MKDNSILKYVETQRELIKLYESQIVDLIMMSKIELGDDVINEIQRLKKIINDWGKSK
jgi:hypothetical protein